MGWVLNRNSELGAWSGRPLADGWGLCDSDSASHVNGMRGAQLSPFLFLQFRLLLRLWRVETCPGDRPD